MAARGRETRRSQRRSVRSGSRGQEREAASPQAPASSKAQAHPACLCLLFVARPKACSLTPGRTRPQARGTHAGASSQVSPQRGTRSSHGGTWASAPGTGWLDGLSDVGTEPRPSWQRSEGSRGNICLVTAALRHCHPCSQSSVPDFT